MPVYKVLSFETDQSLVFVFTVGFSTCSLFALGTGAKFYQINYYYRPQGEGNVFRSKRLSVHGGRGGDLDGDFPLDGDPPALVLYAAKGTDPAILILNVS